MKIKTKFPPEIFKTKLEVSKKYRKRNWRGDQWVKILYIGKERFFSIDENGEEDQWFIDTDWIPYEEEPEKELLGYQPFYIHLTCGHLEMVLAKTKEDVHLKARRSDKSYVKIYTKIEAITAGLMT